VRASQQEQISSAGVSRVMADFADLNWGPVENVRHDLGIDIFLQVRDERRFDRAAFVMAQVKTGSCYFADEAKDETGSGIGWWYAERDARHFEDWVQHGLPHLLVLHDPVSRISYWAHVTPESVTSTGDGFKILVPANQRVDEVNREALLSVAASVKASPRLEGTSFIASAKAVAPARVLRHALLTPRLIAPHPNAIRDRTLEPEEAVALVTQGRLSDLDMFVDMKLNPKLAAADATHRDWRWRFFAAYREFVATGDRAPILRLAANTMPGRSLKKEQAYRVAACAVMAAVVLADAERWDEAQSVLLATGDDLPPVDHAWVLVHRAVVLAERGEVSAARTLAARAQRTVNLDADDVTANAIGSAAAELIFGTAGWGTGELAATLTAGDTAASWWRSQAVSWALHDHDESAYKAWANVDDVDADQSGDAQDRLLGAWPSASLAGARSAAANVLATRVHHDLVHHEVAWRSATAGEAATAAAVDKSSVTDAGEHVAASNPRLAAVKGLEDGLDRLRRYGRHSDLEIAVRRLWAAGPAAAVRTAVQHSVAAPWSHTTARPKLSLLELAGDLLDAPASDAATQQCLDALANPMPFAEQIRPTFGVAHLMHRGLKGVLPAASDAAHEQVIEYVLQAVPENEDPAIEQDLAQLVVRLRPLAVLGQAERLRTAALRYPGQHLSATVLAALLPGGNRDAETELLRRADAGDRHAAAVLGSATALSPLAAAALIDREVAVCRQIVTRARQGAYGLGSWDSGRALTVLNLTFPALAQWEPVVELVLDPEVARDDKIEALHVLAARADDLPDDVAAALRGAATSGAAMHSPLGMFRGPEEFVEAVSAVALAVGVLDTASAMRRILGWLRGSAAQRQAAGGLLGVLGHRAHDLVVQGALVMLTGDPQYQVRASAVAALTRGTPFPIPEVVEEAIVAAAGEAGCAVPLSVARALRAAPEAWPRREVLLHDLSLHMSARVSSAVALR
jgi:Domain of unknown function (DUF4365)